MANKRNSTVDDELKYAKKVVDDKLQLSPPGYGRQYDYNKPAHQKAALKQATLDRMHEVKESYGSRSPEGQSAHRVIKNYGKGHDMAKLGEGKPHKS